MSSRREALPTYILAKLPPVRPPPARIAEPALPTAIRRVSAGMEGMDAQSLGPATTLSGRPRRRAVEACSFCRRRKIKCNNEQPTCANCRTYGKDCIYEPLATSAGDATEAAGHGTETPSQARKPSRPPTRKAAARARQKSAPRSEGRSSHATPPDETEHRSEAAAEDGAPQPESPVQPRAGVSRIVVSPNGVSSYHGRTSTLYEEHVQDRAAAADSRPRMPEDWIEKGLVAEAAKQRQLEEYNYHAGLLDFDGVEPELGMHLLSLHWNRQHHSFNITYRPAFMRDMACAGPYFSRLLLNAIYFGASKFSPRKDVRKDPNDVRTAGWEFRERVRKLLGSALDRSDVTTIQALLVMTNSLFALGDERSAAWLYAGLAFRMIIDLGMHVDAPDLGRKFSDEDLEIRRRVFWAAFIVDKIQSLYQGRPVTLKESDTLVPIKFLDTFEEFEHWKPFAYNPQTKDYPGSPAYSVSTFTGLCQLSVAMSDILSSIYAERSFNKTPAELSALLESLDSKLTAWKDSLPEHLRLDPAKTKRPSPPHVFSLHAMYHVLVILLHRPFVADGHLYSTIRSISVNSFINCASSADRIMALLRAYDSSFSVRHAPYLISYACYVAATIHVRIASRRGAESEAHNNLAACLAIFRENQETNWAVKRAHGIVQSLMKRLGVPEPPNETIAVTLGRSALPQPASPGHTNQNNSSQPGNAVPEQPDYIMRGQEDQNSDGSFQPQQVSPTMGWSDIDGIIQSFVRGPEVQPPGVDLGQQQFQGYPAEGFMQQQASAPPMARFAHPGVDPMGASDYRQQQPGMDDGSWAWNPGMPDGGATSYDDLLFGLNSSALDSYTF